MTSCSYTLLVFEGTTESNVVDNLKQYFIANHRNTLVYASFGHNIYQLYREMDQDSGLDLYGILCEVIERRHDLPNPLQQIEREHISDIFLFFDYDPHTTNASDTILANMLAHFDDSQDAGKLFINYPMLEAIRHAHQGNYSQVTYPIDQLTRYKRFLTQRNEQGQLINIQEQFLNWGLYDKSTWKLLIEINLTRANDLVFNSKQLPQHPIEQEQLFANQKSKHIDLDGRVSVISAFALMLHEYYGSNLWQHI